MKTNTTKKNKIKKGGMEGIRSKEINISRGINKGNYLKGLIIPGTDEELNLNNEVAFSQLMKAIDDKDNDLIKQYLICKEKSYYESVIGNKLGSGVYGAVYQYGPNKVLKLSHSESESDSESESESESELELESPSSSIKSSIQKSYQTIADSMKSMV